MERLRLFLASNAPENSTGFEYIFRNDGILRHMEKNLFSANEHPFGVAKIVEDIKAQDEEGTTKWMSGKRGCFFVLLYLRAMDNSTVYMNGHLYTVWEIEEVYLMLLNPVYFRVFGAV